MPTTRGLDGLQVLVTRPAPQGERLCQQIRQLGGGADPMPSLQIEPLPLTPAQQRQVASLGDYQWLIFVSPNAVRLGMAAIAAQGGIPPGVQVAMVGAGSARCWRQLTGRAPDVVPEQRFDSEGLLAMPAMAQVAGQRVMIVRGEDGRPLLGEVLAARGAQVSYLSVYRRVLAAPPPDLAERLQRSDIIVTTSRDVLEALYRLTGPAWRSILLAKALIVVSARSLALARQLGFVGPLLEAPDASDETMLALLRQFYRGD